MQRSKTPKSVQSRVTIEGVWKHNHAHHSWQKEQCTCLLCTSGFSLQANNWCSVCSCVPMREARKSVSLTLMAHKNIWFQMLLRLKCRPYSQHHQLRKLWRVKKIYNKSMPVYSTPNNILPIHTCWPQSNIWLVMPPPPPPTGANIEWPLPLFLCVGSSLPAAWLQTWRQQVSHC